ncbi:MAG: hypothetical protein J6B23_08245 [Clostridia bacterium]|nr:hypothetical protein [Clostridia bacterium]
MKKYISIILTIFIVFNSALFSYSASFEADNAAPLKAPFISRGTTSHPDTTKVYDFNNVGLSAFVQNGDSNYSSVSIPSVCVGSSGEEGDKAYYFVSKTNEAFVTSSTATSGTRSQLYIIYDTKLGDTILSWKGKQIVEFDVKADNSNGRLGFMMWYMWASGYHVLKEDGKISGTDYSYPIDEWFHIKMVFENHYWNVYVTDSGGEHHIVKNVKATGTTKPGNTWSQGSRMAFLFSQPNAVESEDERMGFALDNFHAYRLYPTSETNDISNYVSCSYEEVDGSAADELPHNGKILLDFPEASDTSLFDSENIVLEDRDGSAMEYEGTYENGVYVIKPYGKLTRATQYKLRISDELRKIINPDNPPTGSIVLTVRDDASGDVRISNAELIISDDSVKGTMNCTTTTAKSADVYIATYNYDKTLQSVKPTTALLSSGDTYFETDIDNIDVKNGMYAVCYLWSGLKPLSPSVMFSLPNTLEYGTYIFEAEKIRATPYKYCTIASDTAASDGRIAHFTAHRWDTAESRPASDGTEDSLCTNINIANEEQSGDYALWLRYKLLSDAQGSFIWYRYNDIPYARKHMNTATDGVYRWACISLSLNEGDNELAFSSGVPSYIDKFILTKNLEFTPSGMDDTPTYVTDEILEKQWATLWTKPPVAPPEGHPRLYITPEFIPTLKENLNSSENGWMYDKFKNRYAYETLNCKLDTTKTKNHNSILLVKIMSRALVYVLGDETDINHAKQTVSYMRDYLDTVRTPSDEGDITRVRGDILVAAAVVYDWCYNALSDDDKAYFKEQFIRIAASKEIGWPPRNMSSVASHAGEQEIWRDLLAAGVAIYDEYPLYYNMAAGRMFEEMIPSREWLRESGRSEYGNDYAECRGYSEMWAGMTFKRMGYDISPYGNATKEPFSWLIHSRMPYGAMMPYGDMYTITRSDYKLYDRNYMITYLLASNLYQNPQLKQEFLRRFNIAYAGEDVQFWYTLFNDPTLEAAILKDEPLARYATYPLSAIVHKTSNQEGFDSDAAVAFMNMHEAFVGDHQNIYTGDFQIYYKGLLAMNTGTYNASTQHNEGYKRRAIAGNTMLCYNPAETFVPTWSNVAVPNDGGQRTPYLKADGSSKGSAVSKITEYNIDENGIAANRDLIVSENVKHYIGPNEKTPLYSYISGDLTNAYSDKVTSYKRSMVFADLSNDTYPAAFVVYDKMTSKDASFKKTWLMHSQNEPTVSDNVITITRTESDFDGKLVDNVLLPESNTINVVGGTNNEMFTVGGVSMPPKADTIEGGNYRIELSPKTSNLEDEFLNVMYVTDASGGAEPLASSKIETEQFVGASIYDRVILFAKQATVGSQFTLTINSGFDKTHILVADVADGTWNISGGDVNINVASKDGVIYASLPNGTYTFAPTGAAPDDILYAELTKRKLGDFAIWKYVSNVDGNGSVNGNFLYQAKPTVVSGGIPCVALETLSQFGAQYSRASSKITITKDGKTASLTVRNTSATIDGTSKTLSKAPFAQDSTVYVPITDLGEFLGYEFSYSNMAKMLKANPK